MGEGMKRAPGGLQGGFAAANTTALAFIGDAVYEVRVRDHVMRSGLIRADGLHRAAVKYVRADSQALALKALAEQLSTEEAALVRRARNRRITSKPKNADPVDYKHATAFEALIGALYMAGENDRLDAIVRMAIAAIDRQARKPAGQEEAIENQ